MKPNAASIKIVFTPNPSLVPVPHAVRTSAGGTRTVACPSCVRRKRRTTWTITSTETVTVRTFPGQVKVRLFF
jgi:hypothetical protein